jgi:hypothetical protein
MHTLVRKLSFGYAMLLPFAFSLSPVLNAQNAQDDGPPNVLIIQREYLKPGKAGMLHERSESRLCPRLFQCEVRLALLRHGLPLRPHPLALSDGLQQLC